MTSLAEAPPRNPIWPTPYRVNVEQFLKMAEVGIFGSSERVELIQGILAVKMPTLPPHTYTTFELATLLFTICGSSWAVRSQGPVLLSDDSMPEPDVCVAVGNRKAYSEADPMAHQLVLVIEVSKSSLQFDLSTKMSMYAAAKVPEYWVVDVVGKQVYVHTAPRGGKKPGYRSVQVVGSTGRLAVTLSGKAVGFLAVKEFLP